MEKQFFIANWKSNKTPQETEEWLKEFQISNIKQQISQDKKVIVCPPFPLLSMFAQYVKEHNEPIEVGSQDISPFSEGAYTGAVSGKLLRAYATYAIIGHSERRKYFHETKEELAKKVTMALSCGITPIYCVSDKDEKIPEGVTIVAFEPITAIGSGSPEDPNTVEVVARFIKEKNSVVYVVYGGSVTPENVAHYTSLPSIHGVLIGGAGLDPKSFAAIIQYA